MITRTTQASASQKPSHTASQNHKVAFANAFACLSQAKGISWPLVVSNRICVVKLIRAEGKVTSLCGYLLVSGKLMTITISFEIIIYNQYCSYEPHNFTF
jgi:hypothetical protein